MLSFDLKAEEKFDPKHHVEKILGRPALPFGQWVSEHRDLFTN